MTEKLNKIVVRLVANHPTGSRNRAGFQFSQDPCTVEVTKTQLKEIQDDKYLIILTRGTAFEQGKEKVGKKLEKKQEEEIKDDKKSEEVESEEIKKDDKEKIIEKLLEKGLKKGLDFNEEADLKDLEDLLIS